MKKINKAFPGLSDQTFKVMEVNGKEEIFIQDFHSDKWNDGQENFGVKKINELSETTEQFEDIVSKLTDTFKILTNKTDVLTNTANKLTVITKEHANAINELIKKLQQLEEEFEKSKHYEGEYKWMPTTVITMPVGWKKVNLTKGFTLVAGENEGTTTGAIIDHIHTHNYYSIRVSEDVVMHGAYKPVIISVKSQNTTYNTSEIINDTPSDSNNNRAAGKYSILWQYDPKNKFSKTTVIKI